MSDVTCKDVEQHLVDVLDGTADEALLAHLVDCEDCRDLRHEAEEIEELVAEAGADYEHPEDFEERLVARLDALDEEEGEPSTSGVQRRDREETEAEAPPSAAPRRRAKEAGGVVRWLRRPRNTALAGLLAAGAAAAVTAVMTRPEAPEVPLTAQAEAWSATVTGVVGDGLQVCRADQCEPAVAEATVEPGASLKTDDRTRAHLRFDDGTTMTLDRRTTLAVADTWPRGVTLSSGAVVAEVAPAGDKGMAAFVVEGGRVESAEGKLAVRHTRLGARVDVLRGRAALKDEGGASVEVAAGEEGRLDRDGPGVIRAPALAEAFRFEETGGDVPVRGLGQLTAKRPGEEKERDGAVVLASHGVKVRIVDGFARTEIDETFSNTTDQVLEGIFRFPLPPDAKIERLALEVDGQLEEGAFVARERAAAIWRGAIVNSSQRPPPIQQDIIWVPGPWKDPALLEWQRGGRFELRIFPIPANGSRRVVLTYTQTLERGGGVQRYTYPLPYDPKGDLRVGSFDVDVEVRGHEPTRGVSFQGYGLKEETTGDVTRLRLHEERFVPTGDLDLEWASAGGETELTAWAYRPAAEEEEAPEDGTAIDITTPYVAMALQPQLEAPVVEKERAYAIVVDSSRSMLGEASARARALTTRLVRELDPLDRFTVLACDTTCRRLPGGWVTPGSTAAADAAAFLDEREPDGGSDPAAAIASAAELAGTAEGRAVRVVFLGDGTPTVGPVRPGTLEAALGETLRATGATVTAVPIGTDADQDSLSAMARAGGGVMVGYEPGRTVAEVAYDVLGATVQGVVTDVTVELPSGLSAAVPARSDNLLLGDTLHVAARMTGPVDGDVVLRGRLGGESVERRIPLQLEARTDARNAFVPRLYAAGRIADLEHRGTAEAREQAVEWSQTYNVASRHTSLLVLESPAMFRAFGLDNQRRAPIWTGEEATKEDAKRGRSIDGAHAATGTVAPEIRNPFGGGGMGKASKAMPAAPPRMRPPPPPPPPPPAAGPRPDLFGDDSAEASPPAPRSRPKPRPACAPNDPLCSDLSWNSRRTMVPMRRVWERTLLVQPQLTAPAGISADDVAKAEQALRDEPNSRDAVATLYRIRVRTGDLQGAAELARRWVDKEPLDPDALTARADVTAMLGDQEEAIRQLGSVLDVRPGDLGAQRRLARLHRWAGDRGQACRHSIALAEVAVDDPKAVAPGVRCARERGMAEVARKLLGAVSDTDRSAVERELEKEPPPTLVRGDLRLEATWTGAGEDLDLALIHPNGFRVSWLGAPTKALIRASDVHAPDREQLALLGSPAGEYVVEIVRTGGPESGSRAPVSGEVTVFLPNGGRQRLPFTLTGTRAVVGVVRVGFTSRLIPW